MVGAVSCVKAQSPSFHPNAEVECEKYLRAALEIDPQSVEALQTYSSFRISQQNPEDALKLLKQSYALWKNIEG